MNDTSKKEGHTPVPWNTGNTGTNIFSSDSGILFTGSYENILQTEANAQLIIKAVNSHAKLVEALNDFCSWMEGFGSKRESEFLQNNSPYQQAKALLNEIESQR